MPKTKRSAKPWTKITLTTAYILASIIMPQAASADQAPKARTNIIKLICSGLLNDWNIQAIDIPLSGVYAEISGDLVSIYNVGGFPEYNTGMRFIVYLRNPSKIMMKHRNNENIIASINRINGDISVTEMAPASDRMVKRFTGTCVNPKPVF